MVRQTAARVPNGSSRGAQTQRPALTLVVDTNILFSFFWKGSVTRALLMKSGLDTCAPEYALEEIRTHEREIRAKTGLSVEEFDALRYELVIAVRFVPLETYQQQLERATRISPDPDDVDFFALALHEGAPLWSNDTLLKRQKTILVLSTKELLELREIGDVLFPFGQD